MTGPRRRRVDLAIWGALPSALAFAAALRPLSDPDAWWHLAAGRIVLEGRLPLTNTLSHTFADHPWRFTQWLSAASFALAETLGGLPAVQILVGAFAAGTFLLVIATARREILRPRWFLVLPLVAVGVLSVRGRLVPRGDIATLLGLALVHYLWVARPRRLPLFLFLAGCVWSNLHSGVVFGVLEIAVFGCAAILDRDRKSIRDALACGAAFFAGSLVSPFFHYPYIYILENLDVARHFPVPIEELLPPRWRLPQVLVPAVIASLALVSAAARRRYRDVLLIAWAGAMAAGAVRFVPFLVVLALPGAARSLDDWFGSLAGRRSASAAGAVLAAPVLAAALYVGGAEWRQSPPGFGADLRRFPAGAADFIRSKGFTGRMFNEFDQGGFLAWRLFPGRRVFIDGRGNAYPWDHFRQVAGYTRETIPRVLDAYGIDHAVVQRRPGTVDWGPVVAAIGWELVHVEGAAFLFVRPGSPDAARARDAVFRSLVPGATPGSLLKSARENPLQMRSELVRIDPGSVLEAGEFLLFGTCSYLAGDPGLAIRFFEEGLAFCPADLVLRMNHAFVLDSIGRTAEAMAEYRQIVRKAPASEVARIAAQRLEVIGRAVVPGTGAAR